MGWFRRMQVDGRETPVDGRGTTVEGPGTTVEGRGTQVEGRGTRTDGRRFLTGRALSRAHVAVWLCFLLTAATAVQARAQEDPQPEDVASAEDMALAEDVASPDDVASPEAIVTAAYRSLDRAPGEPFDWDRFRSLFLPQATLIPNTQQTGGDFRVLSPEGFIEWIDAVVPIGGPDDQGFTEEEVSSVVERYGNVAHVFSTYQKRFWEGSEVLGRGINSFQLVRHGDRWWIVGIVWDEEVGAGPIPEKYLD